MVPVPRMVVGQTALFPRGSSPVSVNFIIIVRDALLCPNLDSRRRPTMLTPTTKGAKIRHGNSYVIFSLAIFAFVTYMSQKLRVSRIIVPRNISKHLDR